MELATTAPLPVLDDVPVALPGAPPILRPISGVSDLTMVPGSAWALARRRLIVISHLAKIPRRSRRDAREAAKQLGCGIALVYRLLERYEVDPRLTSLLPRRRGRIRGQFRLSPELDALVQASIDEIYLTRQRRSVTALLREIHCRCQTLALPFPSRKAVQRRIDERSAEEVVRHREGRKRARDRFAPAIGSIEAPRPLALVQIDHTLVDIIVVDSVTRAPIRRPWLTLAIDVCTRCVLGFYLSLDGPSATSVALCLAHAALPKDGWLAGRGIEGAWPMSGLPERLHLDNGKEFHSEALRRGCEQYGITIDYRPVRTPHYGGHIERLIGTVMGKVHLLPGTTFSSIQARGDSDPSKTASLTLGELERWLTTAITGVYHQDLHRGLGTTPLAAWMSYPQATSAGSLRELQGHPDDPRRFLIDFLPIARRMVRREGVFLHSIAYWSSVLTTWIGDPRHMIVRYDPRDLSRIYLLSPEGVYYDLAYRELRRQAISLWEQRAALKHLREHGRRSVDEAAIFEALGTMRRITEHAATETRTVRRAHERQRHWAQAHPPVSQQPVAAPDAFDSLPVDNRRFADVEEWS